MGEGVLGGLVDPSAIDNRTLHPGRGLPNVACAGYPACRGLATGMPLPITEG